MTSVFEHRIELAGVGSRILELDGDGPPLLLLHGYSDSADTWRMALDRMRRRAIAAFAVDLPGFGTADPLTLDEPVLSQLDRFVAAAIGHVTATTGRAPVVAGNSLGGAEALRAAQDPELGVAGVVPIAPAGFDMARWFALIEGHTALRAALAGPVPSPVMRAVVGGVYRTIAFARPAAIDPRVVSAFTSHMATPQRVRETLAVGARLRAELRDCFALERIRCPVTVVWGRQDRMVSPTGAGAITAAIPGTELVLLDGCGHCPQLEAPDELVGVLARVHAATSATSAGTAAR